MDEPLTPYKKKLFIRKRHLADGLFGDMHLKGGEL